MTVEAPATPRRLRSRQDLPSISPLLYWGFRTYTLRYLRRHFHTVRVARDTAPSLTNDDPVICFANHPSWWDPLVAVLLHRLYFPGRPAYAPIDLSALARYPVFRHLGFYGIDLQSRDGARHFLGVTRQLLSRPNHVIWMTPGGRFTDVRQRTEFQTGLSHVAAHAVAATLIPVAVEYTFWEERTPEAFTAFGPAVSTRDIQRSKGEWQCLLQSRLAETQDQLARRVIARDATHFDTVLQGTVGIGGVYDGIRRVGAWWQGQSFDPRHGSDGGTKDVFRA